MAMPATAQANVAPGQRFATTDPVFAVIEQHGQAMQVRLAEHDDEIGRQLLFKKNAVLAWLQTPPTALAGVIATLEHATRRSDDDGNGDHVCIHLA
jgi:hypothetical protein